MSYPVKILLHYEYDGLGHRIGKTESNGSESHTTSYVIDIRKRLIIYCGKTVMEMREVFVWDIQLISEVEDDNRANIICDELGSVILEGGEFLSTQSLEKCLEANQRTSDLPVSW